MSFSNAPTTYYSSRHPELPRYRHLEETMSQLSAVYDNYSPSIPQTELHSHYVRYPTSSASRDSLWSRHPPPAASSRAWSSQEHNGYDSSYAFQHEMRSNCQGPIPAARHRPHYHTTQRSPPHLPVNHQVHPNPPLSPQSSQSRQHYGPRGQPQSAYMPQQPPVHQSLNPNAAPYLPPPVRPQTPPPPPPTSAQPWQHIHDAMSQARASVVQYTIPNAPKVVTVSSSRAPPESPPNRREPSPAVSNFNWCSYPDAMLADRLELLGLYDEDKVDRALRRVYQRDGSTERRRDIGDDLRSGPALIPVYRAPALDVAATRTTGNPSFIPVGDRAPPMTDTERRLLKIHEGCLRCRRPYAGHRSDRGAGCPNWYPKRAGYVPITEAICLRERAKKYMSGSASVGRAAAVIFDVEGLKSNTSEDSFSDGDRCIPSAPVSLFDHRLTSIASTYSGSEMDISSGSQSYDEDVLSPFRSAVHLPPELVDRVREIVLGPSAPMSSTAQARLSEQSSDDSSRAPSAANPEEDIWTVEYERQRHTRYTQRPLSSSNRTRTRAPERYLALHSKSPFPTHRLEWSWNDSSSSQHGDRDTLAQRVPGSTNSVQARSFEIPGSILSRAPATGSYDTGDWSLNFDSPRYDALRNQQRQPASPVTRQQHDLLGPSSSSTVRASGGTTAPLAFHPSSIEQTGSISPPSIHKLPTGVERRPLRPMPGSDAVNSRWQSWRSRGPLY
ncbi:hypothetical protein PENSPDRAFT_755881 [Peniophora sp. CONT]|nr:hypothetical protein PENSPDRAFT_755881 [Peniophora sp. CONT]